MHNDLQLAAVLAEAGGKRPERLAVFALFGLGLIESLANGLISATEALRQFFHADNCLYVRRQLRSSTADELMSRGVQLPDLFEALSAEEAQRQFRHELTTMRALCFKLLERKRAAA